jgi:hypothetical protein
MKKILTSLAIVVVSFISTSASFASSDKSVVIINNNQTPMTITYSLCDGKATLCEFTKTEKIAAGEKLVIK